MKDCLSSSSSVGHSEIASLSYRADTPRVVVLFLALEICHGCTSHNASVFASVV